MRGANGCSNLCLLWLLRLGHSYCVSIWLCELLEWLWTNNQFNHVLPEKNWYITSDWLKRLEIGTHLALHLGIVSLHSSNFLSFLSLKGRYSGTCHPKGPPTMHFYLKFSFTSIIVILFSLYYQTKKSLAARRGLFRGWQTLSANGAKKDGWKNGIGTVSSPVGKTVPVKVNMSTAAAKSR